MRVRLQERGLVARKRTPVKWEMDGRIAWRSSVLITLPSKWLPPVIHPKLSKRHPMSLCMH
jgi:hypothetical protein